MAQFQSNPFEPVKSPMDEEGERIINSLAVSYQQIGARLPKQRRFNRIVNAGLITTLLGLGYIIIFSSSLYKTPELYVVTIWIAVSILILGIFTRKYRTVATTSEENMFINAYELMSELRHYPVPIDMSGPARDLESLIAGLEQNWVLGFPLAREALSGVADFFKNLRFRLLQAIVKGKTEDVKLAVWTLAKLCLILLNEHPKVSQIEEINYELSKLPKWEKVEEVKFHTKMRLWMRNHSTVGISFACALVGIGIIALGDYLGHPAEGFTAGVGGAIALFVGFLLSPRLKKQ